ncbi:hypothetical protein AAFF_G00032580 [Aldrovandia affinis]|uniref:GDP-D-mannose dehydratase n=1 Tax=Aldrovandia affinis TaxID=143900 RepID=A0AAD7S3X1_9TELE|nr:hypothetical protein AAFF_G00032580 [Aldrovandia affinis]
MFPTSLWRRAVPSRPELTGAGPCCHNAGPHGDRVGGGALRQSPPPREGRPFPAKPTARMRRPPPSGRFVTWPLTVPSEACSSWRNGPAVDQEQRQRPAETETEAMWLMLQEAEPEDLVIATGEVHSVREFVEKAFQHVGKTIVWEGEGEREVGRCQESGCVHVRVDQKYYRPTEVIMTAGCEQVVKLQVRSKAGGAGVRAVSQRAVVPAVCVFTLSSSPDWQEFPQRVIGGAGGGCSERDWRGLPHRLCAVLTPGRRICIPLRGAGGQAPCSSSPSIVWPARAPLWHVGGASPFPRPFRAADAGELGSGAELGQDQFPLHVPGPWPGLCSPYRPRCDECTHRTARGGG